MLSRDEEQRLSAFITASYSSLQKDVTYTPEYYVNAVRWLAEKLKETNDELKRANAEIEHINKTFNWNRSD